MRNHSEGTLIMDALKEDIGAGDITSRALVSRDSNSHAVIVAKSPGIICGLEIARDVFLHVDRKLKIRLEKKDGEKVTRGDVVCRISGKTQSILAAERTALNFLQHISGIASRTQEFVKRVHGLDVKILDTRKTIPLLRGAEKYAVKCGGGLNHRMGLYDELLIKNNHIKIAGSVKKAVMLARKKYPRKKIEIEVSALSDAKEAIDAGADILLLDNMTPREMSGVVKISKGKALTEASGNIDLGNIVSYAKTGVDRISIGSELTLCAPAMDLSLRLL